jgi:hypothetical protein
MTACPQLVHVRADGFAIPDPLLVALELDASVRARLFEFVDEARFLLGTPRIGYVDAVARPDRY